MCEVDQHNLSYDTAPQSFLGHVDIDYVNSYLTDKKGYDKLRKQQESRMEWPYFKMTVALFSVQASYGIYLRIVSDKNYSLQVFGAMHFDFFDF